MKLRTLMFPMALLLAAAGLANASESDYCSKPVRIAMFEFGLLYSNGDGIDSRMLDTIARRTGCSFERVLMPRARIWAELKGGTLDMATTAIATPERREFGYLLPYINTRNVLLVQKGVTHIPSTLDELQAMDLQVGKVRGFRHEPAFDAVLDRLAARGLIKEAADAREVLKSLERGMVNAVFSQPLVYRYYMDSHVIDSALVVKDLAPKDQQSVGNLILSRKSFTPEQARRWDRLIAQMVSDGTLYRIARDFLPSKDAKDLMYSGPRNPE